MHIEKIRAIAEPGALAIQAALQNPEVRAVTRLLASADVDLVGKITLRELDKRLSAASKLSIAERLQIKRALDRAGLIG